MATVKLYLTPAEAQFAASSFPQFKIVQGANFPIPCLAYSGISTERAYWIFDPTAYGSGNITCDVYFYNASAAAGACVWEAAVAAITPDTDNLSVETGKSFAVAQQVTKAHPGGAAQRLQKATITITNLDSIAAGDEVWLRLSRLPSDAGDSSSADMNLTSVRLSYSDT